MSNKFDGKYKTIAELKGYSSIDITSKTVDEILDTVNTARNADNDVVNIPIKEGVLILNDVFIGDKLPSFLGSGACKNYIYYKIDETEKDFKMHVESYMYTPGENLSVGTCAGEMIIAEKKEIKIIPLSYREELKNPFIENLLNKSREKVPKSIVDQTCVLALHSLLYVSIVQAQRETIYKESSGMKYKIDPAKRKVTSKTKKVQVISGDKIAYVFTGTSEAMKSFREYKRHTESWDVMGHLRHYKSGLTKWIDSYSKGKGKKDPKTYIIK